MSVNMMVCLKQIQDPEIPPGKFRIDSTSNKVIPPEGVPPVVNPFDEQGIEAALRIKEKVGGKITAMTIGKGQAKDILKHALAMGADEAMILEDDAFDDSDSLSLAYVLSHVVRRIGGIDLIFCGRQAADWDEGQVGPALAELLDIPLLSVARSVQICDGNVRVERVLADGFEVVECSLPALVTISNELGQPRLPTGLGIIQAARKKISQLRAEDIGINSSNVGPAASRTKLLKLFQPARESKCEFIDGETIEEKAQKLAIRLCEAGVI